MSGRLRHKSATRRLQAYFERNPGEMLSYDDIGLKFDLTREQVYSVVDALRQEGFLTTMVMAMRKTEAAGA